VIIAMRAILVALLIHSHILPERLLALLAQERHLRRLGERVLLRRGVAFGAVVPLLTAGRADGDLRVEDVYTASWWVFKFKRGGKTGGTDHMRRKMGPPKEERNVRWRQEGVGNGTNFEANMRLLLTF
jgi:hypothetical protein